MFTRSKYGRRLYPLLQRYLRLLDSQQYRWLQASSKSRKTGQEPSGYRFVDRMRLRAMGGTGGNGAVSSYQVGRSLSKRPDGGHGGNGGSVILVADPKQQTLDCWKRPHIAAEGGMHGSSNQKNGRNGKNRILRVPCGVVVRRVLDYDEVWDDELKIAIRIQQDDDEELDYSEMDAALEDSDYDTDSDDEESSKESELEIDENSSQNVADDESGDDIRSRYTPAQSISTALQEDNQSQHEQGDDDDADSQDSPLGQRQTVFLADLDKPGSHVVVARGGRGGTGSMTFASHHRGVPPESILKQLAQPQRGEVAFLELELKLIADLGLVGFPNAGKSSLLRAMSRATPKVAPYPFTTLHPMVGCIDYQDGFRVQAADVPGLIDGAALGRGQGLSFLRHLERTKALLYLVDIAGVDGRDPVSDLKILVEQVTMYGDGSMINRNALVVANKIDLISEHHCQELLLEIGEMAKQQGIKFDGKVRGISAGVTGMGLGPLSREIRSVVVKSEQERERWEENNLQSF